MLCSVFLKPIAHKTSPSLFCWWLESKHKILLIVILQPFVPALVQNIRAKAVRNHCMNNYAVCFHHKPLRDEQRGSQVGLRWCRMLGISLYALTSLLFSGYKVPHFSSHKEPTDYRRVADRECDSTPRVFCWVWQSSCVKPSGYGFVRINQGSLTRQLIRQHSRDSHRGVCSKMVITI